MKLRVSDMSRNARTFAARAAQTRGGTFVLVGYDGSAIVASEKIRLTMPHERVDILPSDSVECIEGKLAAAVARLRKPIALALRTWRAPGRSGPSHAWAKRNFLGKKS